MHHITTKSLAPCLYFLTDVDLDPGIFILFNQDTELNGIVRAGKDKFEELLDCFPDVMEHTWQGTDGNDELHDNEV